MANVKFKIETEQMYNGILYAPDAQGYATIPQELAEALDTAKKARESSEEYQEQELLYQSSQAGNIQATATALEPQSATGGAVSLPNSAEEVIVINEEELEEVEEELEEVEAPPTKTQKSK